MSIGYKSIGTYLCAMATALMPVLACAQRAYNYTAMDYQSVSITKAEPIRLRVQTLVFILPDSKSAEIGSQSTNQFRVWLRSPESGTASLIGAFVEGQPVQLSIISTSSDGDIEATVHVPTALSHRSEVSLHWVTKDHELLETTNELISSSPKTKL